MLVSNPEFACLLVDTLRCGVLAIDEAGRLAAANDDAQRILGCPEGSLESALGLDCRRVLATRPEVAELLLAALEGREDHDRAELGLSAVDGGPARVLGFSLAPIRDETGAILGATLFFRDLSAFERMGERTRQHDRVAALGEMAARMAHEIRNPLAGMKVIAEILDRRLAPESEEHSLLAELSGELRSIERVVGEGLEFVRPAPPLFKEIAIAGVIERGIARARARSGYAGETRKELAPDLPPLIADPEQLEAVVTNLLVNAMEAAQGSTQGAPEVGVRARVQPAEPARRPLRVFGCEPGDSLTAGDLPGEGARGELVISVSDSGPGVPEAVRHRIFYPFFTTKPEGNGVGLAIAQKIVAEHGGRIELEASRESAGARFHIRLPLDPGRSEATPGGVRDA